MKGEKRTVKIICGGWISAFAMGLWIVFLYTDVHTTCIVWPADHKYSKYPTTLESCVPFSSAVADAIHLTLFAIWIGLQLANPFMYYQIIKTLDKRNLNGMEPGASSTQSAQSRQVAIMLIANGTVFYSCCMVMVIHSVISFLRTKDVMVWDEFTDIVYYHFFGLIFTLNCCINPIVYSLTNNRYRQIFCSVMKNVICKTSNKNSSEAQVGARM